VNFFRGAPPKTHQLHVGAFLLVRYLTRNILQNLYAKVMNKRPALIITVVIVLIAFVVGFYLSSKKTTHPANQSTSSSMSGDAKQLDMSGKQLTSLPSDITNQTDVTNLNLSNNQLTTLPTTIANMSRLEVLNIENNRLESLPAEIGKLTALKQLDLSNNRLMSLPTELGNLTQLQSLNLDGYKGSQSDIEQLKVKLSHTNIKT
jgi:Leucine-rich repeat (LRR) protein